MIKLSMSEEEMFKRKYTKPYEKRIKELEKENAELKRANETLYTMNNNMWVELEEKRAERQGITNRLHQLIKAKEIIKKFSEFVNNEIEYDPEHPQEHTDLWNELCEQAERFLKGENIILEDAQAGNSPFDADEVFNKEMKAYPEQKVK